MADNHCGKLYFWITTQSLTRNMIDRSLLNSRWPWPLTQQPKYAHNRRNNARNGLGMQKTIRNHMSHIKFNKTVKKIYIWDMYGIHLRFLLLVNFLQKSTASQTLAQQYNNIDLTSRVCVSWWGCKVERGHPSKHEPLAQCCFDVGPPCYTLTQH